MRSYYAHLETTADASQASVAPRPVYRSSAIFPAFERHGVSTRILFLGYWILKKNIDQIACIVTLRSSKGKLVSRRNFQITEAKTYRIEAAEELKHAGLEGKTDFDGSLEVEFFSSSNLVFPYPAVVVNYYGPAFSTVVHTAQRVYNDFEDLAKNSQTAVPESGFNIYADEDREPFISFINGPEEASGSAIDLEFYNSEGERLTHSLAVEKLLPYETKILYPAREIDLKRFLNGKEGACKARFQLKWIFPRLVVGNIHRATSAVTITHTYYDCTQATSDSDYWRPSEPEWHPASLMVPLTAQNDESTTIYFYPIYSPSSFSIDLEIYDAKGELVGKKNHAVTISSPGTKLIPIRLKDLCQELGIAPDASLAARIIAAPCEGSRLPARVKLGLDVGISSKGTPCNICTNLQPFNPPIEAKQKSFKWAPVLADRPQAIIWLMNSTPHTHYKKDATVDLTFFRESDNSTIARQLIIPPHGFAVISVDDDPELQRFFQGKIGWFTALTTNPYMATYYFSASPSGIVGGDHGF